jgi:23S rRNA (uracil1939-C5)-methyltransferase
LARAGAEVTLVESFRPAAECAERAAKEQDLGGYVVRSGEAANVLKHLCSVGTRFDLVITNPPRRGMQPAVRSAIADLEPPLIAYVSCDPDTLCRDLDHLSRLGYRVDELLPVDMIPLTDHVETVAFLTKSVRPDRVPLYEDDHIFIIERFAHDSPSYHSGKTHHRLYDAGLVAGASGVSSGLAIGCKTSTNEPLLRAALSKSGAQFTYLALCRGIVGRSGVIQRKTRYERLARSQGHSVVGIAIAPGTGPRIERDLASIGHPVIGDARYGHSPTNRHFEEKYALDRPFLHRIRVEFDHPITGSRVVEQGTLAGELTMVLARLGIVALDVVKQVMVG